MYQNFLSKNKKLNKLQKQKKLLSLKKKIDQIYEWDNEDGKKIKRYIDESIKELIVLLNALGFRTTSSCEGFIRNPYKTNNGKRIKILSVSEPYVIIGPKLPRGKDWESDERQYRKIDHEVREYFYNIVCLLSQFYQKRNIPYDVMIAPEIHNIYSIKLSNIGSGFLEELEEKEKEEKLKIHQKEWKRFTEFLKKKYFSK